MVRLVVAEPGYYTYQANFNNIPEAIREVIGENYTITQPFDTPRVGVICSKNQTGLKFNRQVSEDSTPIYGRFLICGMNNGKPVSLEPKQAERYQTLCYLVQSEDMGDELPAGKVRPKDERFGKKIRFWER